MASTSGESPDGRRVVYVRQEPRQGRSEIWTLPLDGSAEASRLADIEGSVYWPVATPDGRS